MKDDKNNEKLDELILETIGREKPKFEFDKWKQSHQKEIQIYESQEKSQKTVLPTFKPNIWRIMSWKKAACLAASCLIIFSWVVCFFLSKKVAELKKELEQRDVAIARTDDSATINLYLREHQDVIARHVSLPAKPQPTQMRVGQDDILYYELLDDGPEYISPGLIVRGPSSQQQISSPETPVISNGQTLTLSEAKQNAGFNLVSPSWLHPGYKLDQIKRIDGRDAMQLLYTNGINSVSLFEQPLDGQRGLSRQDFREYIVYGNQNQVGGTILAWRDNTLFYVIIGNIEMSQLMDMAQSISARK